MKRKLYIFIGLFFLLLKGLNAYAQDVPVACPGSIVRYGVYGDNGNSVFNWVVTGGTIVTNWNDSIEVSWPWGLTDPQTITVTETNLYGCTGEPYFTTVIISNPSVDIGLDADICQDQTYEFFANSAEAVNYLWQDNSVGETFIASTTGEYWVRIEDSYGCRAIDTAVLTVHQNPVIDLGNDTAICEPGEILTLQLDTMYSEYLWNYEGGTSISSYMNVEASTESRDFWLQVTDQYGCIGSDTITVNFCGEFIIPNAFTPNNDGVNEEWVIENLNLFPEVTVDIYDRGGSNVFKSKGYQKPWDGTDSNGRKLPMDSYYYVIDLHNGETPIVGTVTVIR